MPTIERVTNRQRVLDYILEHGSITQIDAYEHLRPRITSVSQEISRLEQDGHVFEHIREDGMGCHWTRYKLVLAHKSPDTGTIGQSEPLVVKGPKMTRFWCGVTNESHPFKLYGEHDVQESMCTKHFVKGHRLKS